MGNHLSKKGNKNPNYKDGRSNTKIYKTYWGMLNRCYNQKMKSYYRYGKRGITVCEEWKNNFLEFEKWAINNGYSEKLTLDRINNDGNYEPSNCRWVDVRKQSNNRSTNHKITIKAETKGITEWCKIYKIPLSTVLNRIYRGWNEIDAITKDVNTKYRKKEVNL